MLHNNVNKVSADDDFSEKRKLVV